MKKLLMFFVVLSSSYAMADDIYLGQPAYGGNGCPQGTASAVLSPDRKTLSVLFDNYQATAGRGTGRTLDRKSCNLAVPVHVPQGLSVSLFQMDYRGFNDLPRGGSSRFSVEYFFAGQRGPSTAKDFYGSLNDEYLITNQVAATALVWSPCGADTNLRINSSMQVRTNSANEQAMATVDSADIRSGIVYHVQWRRCQ